jgi:uncharacterized membrane protein
MTSSLETVYWQGSALYVPREKFYAAKKEANRHRSNNFKLACNKFTMFRTKLAKVALMTTHLFYSQRTNTRDKEAKWDLGQEVVKVKADVRM